MSPPVGRFPLIVQAKPDISLEWSRLLASSKWAWGLAIFAGIYKRPYTQPQLTKIVTGPSILMT